MRSTTLLILSALVLASWQTSYAQFGEEGKDGFVAMNKAKLAGHVIAVGNYQKPKPLPVFKNRTFCGPSVANETLLIGRNGSLRNAVITLRSVTHKVVAEPGRLILDNKNCAFTPHVQVAAAGSEILLKNSDPILHTVHARLGHETLFNVGLPKWRQVTKRLNRPGVIRINCDVLHTWMSAAIVVTDTPHFAVSDANGSFTIEALAGGSYEMEIWHERLGALGRRILIDHAGTSKVDVVYSAETRR